jgi:hypothetical protein
VVIFHELVKNGGGGRGSAVVSESENSSSWIWERFLSCTAIRAIAVVVFSGLEIDSVGN